MAKAHLLHVAPPLPPEEAALMLRVLGDAAPHTRSRCGTGRDRAVPLDQFEKLAPQARCGRCDLIAGSPGLKVQSSGQVTLVTRSFLADTAPIGLRGGGEPARGRVRVLVGWERYGRTGRVLGPDVTPPGCVTWTPVLWDDEEDPDWHKASGLVAIPEDTWSSPGAPPLDRVSKARAAATPEWCPICDEAPVNCRPDCDLRRVREALGRT